MGMTAVRQAIAAKLEETLGVTFVDGRFTPAVLEQTLGCTFPLRKGELAENVDVEQLEIGVTVALRYDVDQEQNPELPFNPEPLETLVEQIQAALGEIQVLTGGSWYSRMVDASYDLETQSATCRVLAWDWNTGGGFS